MTRLFNDPKKFATEAIAGLTTAYPDRVQGVHGGVVRATASPTGEVAVVIGGGSGHYPAFAGWVGPGLAHGAACGNVFASPSASQVHSVCRAADNGGGILLSFGNYAGDVLHFGQAAERLRAEGIDVRVVPVSDDVASNVVEQSRDRRGTCGDLVVFKLAGAAAERGDDLDSVEQIAWRANDRTRSLGVAFDGCTVPGADAPLFTVPEGQMAVGLGVHGEPGVSEAPMGTANDVAELLVRGILAEEPPRGQGGYEGRAIVLLNGLGTIKQEELFVTYGRVASLLEEAGITPVQPEVGELMSSLDMAGLSLTLCFLDTELEQLWASPVDTVAFRRGALQARELRGDIVTEPIPSEVTWSASPESRELGSLILAGLTVIRDTAEGAEPELARIDAIAGDGDHGQGMTLGTRGAVDAAARALAGGAGAGTVLVRAGEAWSESAGGTSGALWGAALIAAGRTLADDQGTDAAGLVAAAVAGCEAILQLGGATPGDKTMVDAMVPFRDVLTSEFAGGRSLADSWAAAAAAATAAAATTADIVARRGRSRVLGDKSLGTPDPGAVSFALLATSLNWN